jgi:hypothetical protein
MALRSLWFPDPLVSGNLYCSHELDSALLRLAVPLRRRLREAAGDGVGIWVVRYAKRGEHLKVRIHGPREIEEPAREILRRTAEELLGALGPPRDEPRKVRPDAIAIDQEDRSPDEAPDRSFVFTHYGRSHVSLGGEPWLQDDEYRALMTTCLARACDLLLDVLEPRLESGEIPTHGQRQKLLLKALLSGIAALRFPRKKAEAYLAYHRDWLIRFPLRAGGDEQRAADALAHLDQRTRNATTTVAALGRATAAWTGTPPAAAGAEPWPQALADLMDYLARFRDDPEYRLDPFAEDAVFSPLFKVFHGLANQLGLRMLDEAYAHHLLLRSSTRDPTLYRSLALIPPLPPDPERA